MRPRRPRVRRRRARVPAPRTSFSPAAARANALFDRVVP